MVLKDKIQNAPTAPGCYLFKDSNQNIIYIGKAKVLKNRVKQYFMESNQKDEKGYMLGKLISDVDFVITTTERDALMEEYRLIKLHLPWFNRQHKHDKKMTCYIKLVHSAPYPFFIITKEKSGPDKDYLGAFRNSFNAKEAITFFNKVFKTPLCGQVYEQTTYQPCFYYQIKQCLGPCGGKADVAEYSKNIQEMVRFFKGQQMPVLRRLKREMDAKVKLLAFEQAAEIKAAMEYLILLSKRNQHMIEIPSHRDALILFRAFRETGFTMYYIHRGTVTGKCDFEQQLAVLQLTSFLRQAPTFSNQLVPESLAMIRAVHGEKLVILIPVKRDLDHWIQLIVKKYNESYVHDTVFKDDVPETADPGW
jgi:excinuclease ABC subunit C